MNSKLTPYRAKRTFARTPEPRGAVKRGRTRRFVIQKHAARRLHYDFRLEHGGVLVSWAVPNGIPTRPKERHLAVHVEDHPLAYRTFEGRIPAGSYGAGVVRIWDEGTYEELKDIERGLEDGKIEIRLHGKKTNGDFVLVRMDGRVKNGWLMMKMVSALAEVRGTRPKRTPMPSLVRPMLAQLTDQPFDRDGWIFEPKWDGYRILAFVRNGSVRLLSRNGQAYTDKMPTLVRSLERLPLHAVIDGEAVVLDARGRPSFQLIQNYFKFQTGRLAYKAFDLLYLNGFDLRQEPLRNRKRLLHQLIEGLEPDTAMTHAARSRKSADHGQSRVEYSEHVEKRGKAFFRKAVKRWGEGMMAKRADSTYQEGRRSSDWLKVKVLPRQEVVIAGYTEPRGSRKDLGALILAVQDHGDWRYVGHVSAGSSETDLRGLARTLAPLVRATAPFADVPKTNAPVHWVEPRLVGEVRFLEWTGDGVMRHPVFLGLRPDKSAPHVVKEEAIRPTDVAGADMTNLEKVFWPNDKITKGDLARYYEDVAPYLLPHLQDRPLVMRRFPDGIDGEAFYQKDNPKPPRGIKTISVRSESEDRAVRYLRCENRRALRYVVQLGSIEMHAWLSRASRIARPDFVVFDLDPEDIAFARVVETARVLKNVLDLIGADAYCKTSGASGLHICVPLDARYTYEQSRLFAQVVASFVHRKLPRTTSLERSPSKRQGRVYLDCLQNRMGQTIVAPYSVRPLPRAPVSMPLAWKEVTKRLHPERFTLRNALERLERVGDLWKPVLGPGIDLKACLEKIERIDDNASQMTKFE